MDGGSAENIFWHDHDQREDDVDKIEKKWYVENRWLPAVNSMRDKYGYDGWNFMEIAENIRDIKNRIRAKLAAL